MRESTRQASLVISIDVPQASESATVRTLIELLRHHRAPATWAVEQPAAAGWALPLAEAGHEVALLGDESWIGHRSGRTRFARHLNRRVEEAQQAGFKISTLALRATRLRQHLDLLVKHRISVVRGTQRQRVSNRVRPESLRYGVWHMPPNWQVPDNSAWGKSLQWLAARRQLQRALQTDGMLHVTVDALALSQAGAAWHTLKWILAWSTKQRDSLRMTTLARLAEALRRPMPQPARSILRKVA